MLEANEMNVLKNMANKNRQNKELKKSENPAVSNLLSGWKEEENGANK